MNARLALCCSTLVLAACNGPQPALTANEVEQFVRDYAAATNDGDGFKIMSMVQKDAGSSSIAGGGMARGWEAMKVATDASLEKRKGKIVLATIQVTPLSADAAVAVGTLNVQGTRQVGDLIVNDLPGAYTLVVRRTPEGLRLVHEHYSIRTK